MPNSLLISLLASFCWLQELQSNVEQTHSVNVSFHRLRTISSIIFSFSYTCGCKALRRFGKVMSNLHYYSSYKYAYEMYSPRLCGFACSLCLWWVLQSILVTSLLL